MDKEDPILHYAKSSFRKVGAVCLSTICIIILAVVLGIRFLHQGYIQIDFAIMVLAMAIPIFAFLGIMFYMVPDIYIFGDYIVVIALLRQKNTICFKDITAYSPVINKNESGVRSINGLHIFYNKGRITIDNLSENTALAIIDIFKEKGIGLYMRDTTNYLHLAIGFFFVFCLPGLALFFLSYYPDSVITREKGETIKHLKGYFLAQQPSYDCNRGEIVNASLTPVDDKYVSIFYFTIKGINGFTFMLKNNDVCTTQWMISQKMSTTDTIDFDISQYDYDVKITHKRQPSFWDKHYNWSGIEAFYIGNKDLQFSKYQ